MNIKKVLTGLRDERERINAAITAVERLANVKASSGSSMKRPGRPPGSKNKPKAGLRSTEILSIWQTSLRDLVDHPPAGRWVLTSRKHFRPANVNGVLWYAKTVEGLAFE